MSDSDKETVVAQRWECGDCGGALELVDHKSSPANATESFECLDCGATGDVLFSEGPDDPTTYGSVVPK